MSAEERQYNESTSNGGVEQQRMQASGRVRWTGRLGIGVGEGAALPSAGPSEGSRAPENWDRHHSNRWEGLAPLPEVWAMWLDHRDFLYRLCLGWTRGNQAETDDLLSQALMRVLRRDPATLRKVESPRGWMVRVVKNLWLDSARSRNRADSYQAEIEQVLHSSVPPAPDAVLVCVELGERLGQALEGLPKDLRSVLIQRHIDGLSYREIAERHNISQPTARKRCQLARDRLRGLLGTAPARERHHEGPHAP